MSEYEAPYPVSFTAADISQNDIQKILSCYGQDLEDIYTLGAGQRWILNICRKNDSSFILRILFKADIPVDPLSFRRKVNEVSRRQESLRFAYIYENLSKPYVAVLKNRTAELHFEDLSAMSPERQDTFLLKAGEEDAKRGFDLKKDPLLRITVFKLEGNRHAFLLSMHHINLDGMGVGVLLKEIFIDYSQNIDTAVMPEVFSYKSYARYLEKTETSKELSYWKEYLKDIPESVKLPGMMDSHQSCRNAVETVLFPAGLRDRLLEAQKSLKTTEFNLLTAAWVIMLNRISGTEDVVFGVIASGREPGPERNMFLAGNFALVLPLRVRPDGEKKISDILKEIQFGLGGAMKYSHCTADELDEALGRKQPTINCFLDYQNFMYESQDTDIGIPGFQMMEVNQSGDMSYDLVVCFAPTPKGYGVVFGYNAGVFSSDTIRLYGDCFLKTLEAVISGNDIRVSETPDFDISKFEYAKNASLITDLKKVLLLKKLFPEKTIDDKDLLRLAGKSFVRKFAQEEKIFSRGDAVKEAVFIVKGLVEAWAEQKNGWSVPMGILKEGEILNIEACIDDLCYRHTAISYTEETELLFMPKEEFRWLLRSSPEISFDILKDFLYKLWGLESMWLEQ